LASRSTFSFDLIFPGRARPLRSPALAALTDEAGSLRSGPSFMSIVTVERNVGRERSCSKAPRSVGWAGTKTNR